MQKKGGVVQSKGGRVVVGAVIQVYLAGTSTPATIFADKAGTEPITQLVSDNEGEFEFYAPNGRYDIKTVINGRVDGQYLDELLFDAADVPDDSDARLDDVESSLTIANASITSLNGTTSGLNGRVETLESMAQDFDTAHGTAIVVGTWPDGSTAPVSALGEDEGAAKIGYGTSTVGATLDAITGNGGANNVGFIQSGTGAVARKVQDKLREVVNIKDFGAIADWNGTTGTNNTGSFTAALAYMKSIGGGVLYIPPGDYFFGSHSTSASIVQITGLSNTLINAYGARFIVNTTAESTPFLFVFDNPNNIVLAGARFFDVGFNPASWLTHDRWGIGAVALTTSVECRGFKMVDCEAQNLTYMLVADHRASKRKLKDITVQDCRVKNAYYGVDVLYVGDNLKVQNLICEDVRRGVISFGLRNADLDIKLRTSQGFNGSNSFISIACEGEAYNDGNGVIGTDANVENVRVQLNVSGFEAHSNYITLYHQQADSSGSISNIHADVRVNNLSAVGKAAGIDPANLYSFKHELPNASILGATSRKFVNISLDGAIVGSITGSPVSVMSSNSSTPATVALSPDLTNLAHTYTVNALTNPASTKLLTPFARALTSLSPVGATTAGTPTGLTSNGTYTVIGKCVFGTAQLAWTGHSGTGQLRINGLPLPIDTAFPAPVITIMGSGLSHSAGTTLAGVLGGVANKQILIYEDNAGTISTVNVDTAVVALYVSFVYFTP